MPQHIGLAALVLSCTAVLAVTAAHTPCTAQLVGNDLDVPGHDLKQSALPSLSACTAGCCSEPKVLPPPRCTPPALVDWIALTVCRCFV